MNVSNDAHINSRQTMPSCFRLIRPHVRGHTSVATRPWGPSSISCQTNLISIVLVICSHYRKLRLYLKRQYLHRTDVPCMDLSNSITIGCVPNEHLLERSPSSVWKNRRQKRPLACPYESLQWCVWITPTDNMHLQMPILWLSQGSNIHIWLTHSAVPRAAT